MICQISDGNQALESSGFNLGLTFDENVSVIRNGKFENIIIHQHLPIICHHNDSTCKVELKLLGKRSFIFKSVNIWYFICLLLQTQSNLEVIYFYNL